MDCNSVYNTSHEKQTNMNLAIGEQQFISWYRDLTDEDREALLLCLHTGNTSLLSPRLWRVLGSYQHQIAKITPAKRIK